MAVEIKDVLEAFAFIAGGGLGAKVIESWTSKTTKNIDANVTLDKAELNDLSNFRRELMEEVNHLRDDMRSQGEKHSEEIASMARTLDEWRIKYFELLRKYNELEVKYQSVIMELDNVKHALLSGQPVEVILRRLGDVDGLMLPNDDD